MKVTAQKQTPSFTPVALTIQLDNQAELDALYCIFSVYGIHVGARNEFDLNLEPIQRKLADYGGNDKQFADFVANVKRQLP